eukprot:4786498-Prorocentrum_lima.AAC.1
MTSSLVGSEMCIRDSKRPQTQTADMLASNFSATERLSGRKPPTTTRSNFCLLYTSDAADDM